MSKNTPMIIEVCAVRRRGQAVVPPMVRVSPSAVLHLLTLTSQSPAAQHTNNISIIGTSLIGNQHNIQILLLQIEHFLILVQSEYGSMKRFNKTC